MTTRDTVGREPIVIVEIDQVLCAETYGFAPCTAALGVTGERRCFNTSPTCQDTANFNPTATLILRFCTQTEDTGLPKTQVLIPSLISVTSVPTKINLAGIEDTGPLGQRAQVEAEFRDHPYHDRLVDPYWQDRTYDAMTRGTFWSKWLKRNPFYRGTPLRVLDGYVGQTLGQMRTRHYVIERIEGPANGVVKIVAHDPIGLLDSKTAQCPAPSPGLLSEDMGDPTDSPPPNTFTLQATSPSAGSFYPSSGTVRIGTELMTYTRIGDVFTVTERGTFNTESTAHEAESIVQDVFVITDAENLSVVDVLRIWIEDFAGVDPALIPFADWEAEDLAFLATFNTIVTISEPTGIADLVGEMLAQSASYIWWDEQTQTIQFRAVRSFSLSVDGTPKLLSDDANVIADTLEIVPRPDERVSQVWIYCNQINPVEGTEEPTNYDGRAIVRDAEAESDLEHGEPRIKTIFARWLTVDLAPTGEGGASAATTDIAERILERFAEVPQVLTFETDFKDSTIKTGDPVFLIHRDIVDEIGDSVPTLLQVTSAEEIESGHRMRYEARPLSGTAPQPNQWTPVMLGSSLTLWLDSSDADTVITNSPPRVSEWRDKSGNGYHATQTTPGVSQPVGSVGEISFISGGGVGAFLNLPNMTSHLTSQATLVFAAKVTLDPPLLSGDAGPVLWSTTAAAHERYPATNGEVVSGFASTTINATTNPSATLADWHLHYVSSGGPGGNWEIGFDGSLAFNSSATFGFRAASRIGNSDVGGNAFWNGTLGEIVLCNTVLDIGNKQKLEGYLAHKWGSTARLVSGHPYKFKAPTIDDEVIPPESQSVVGIRMAGTGALRAAMLQQHQTPVQFVGAGALAANATVTSAINLAEASFSGAGSLSAAIRQVDQAAARFSGAGALSVVSGVDSALLLSGDESGDLLLSGDESGSLLLSGDAV